MGEPDPSRIFLDWCPVPDRVVVHQGGYPRATISVARKPVNRGLPTIKYYVVDLNLIRCEPVPAGWFDCTPPDYVERWYGWEPETRTVVVTPSFRVGATFRMRE